MPERKRLLRSALSVALTYAAASSLWILGTDIAAGIAADLPPRIIFGSVSKGLFFVLATTIGLYFLVRAHLLRLQAAEARKHRAERMRELGEIASGITHDFREILSSCSATVAEAEAGSIDPAVRSSMKRIASDLHRGEILAEEVLTFAEPRAPIVEKVPLAPLLEKLEAQVRPALGDVAFKWDIEPRSLAVAGDRELLWRALLNVVENAREAIERSGSIVIRARTPHSVPPALQRGVAGRNDLVEITVHDTGRGMEPDLLARMFEPMVTTKRGSMGLGLAIVHRTIHEHGGVVSADSVPRAGTTVSIVLPAWKVG